MRNNKKNIFGTVYKILGPDISTQLATGTLGRIISFMLHPSLSKYQIYKTSDGIELKLTRKEAEVFGVIYLKTISPHETNLIKSKLNKGDIFIDIGAYVDGWYSFIAAKSVGEKGKVYAFEPHPEYFERFKENIKINKLKNIIATRVAIGNKNGLIFLYEAVGTSSVVEKHTKGQPGVTGKKLKVHMVKMDSYIKEAKIKKVNFVKIDVEGFEMQVLLGMQKTLANYSPALLIEVVPQYLRSAGSSRKKLLEFLKSLGYKPFVFKKDGTLTKYPDKEAVGLNMFFSNKASSDYYGARI